MVKTVEALIDIMDKNSFYFQVNRVLQENKEEQYVLIRFDVYRFKMINDLFGMDEGDRILKIISEKIIKRAAAGGLCGHLHADCFAIMLPQQKVQLDKIKRIIEEGCADMGIDYDVEIYIGIYEIKDINVQPDVMCDRANIALETVKGSSQKFYAYYDKSLRTGIIQEINMLQDAKKGINKEEFFFELQPIWSISDERPVSAEALLRWKHPTKGILGPEKFISTFEENGYITQLDKYIWEEVCKYLSELQVQGKELVPISVNVSRGNFYDPDLPEVLLALVEKYNLNTDLLKLEIIERAYMDDPIAMLKVVQNLQHYGFQILMDDFGSEYSSLNMLKDIPVNALKIDKRFIDDIETSDRVCSLLSNMVRMARWLEIIIIAEGVETKRQLEFLRSIGCDLIQGYYYSKSMIPDKFTVMLESAKEESADKDIYDNLQDVNVDELMDQIGKVDKVMNNILSGFALYELVDGNLEIMRVNDAYYEITGSSPKTLFKDNKNEITWIHKEDRQLLLEACMTAEKEHSKESVMVRRYHQDNSLLLLQINIKYMGTAGKGKLFYFVINDFTKQRPGSKSSYLGKYKELLKSAYHTVLEIDYDKEKVQILVESGRFKMDGSLFSLEKALHLIEKFVRSDERKFFREILIEEKLEERFKKTRGNSFEFKVHLDTIGSLWQSTGIKVFKTEDFRGQRVYLLCMKDIKHESGAQLGDSVQGNRELGNPERKKRVLVVDDSGVNRKVLKKMLADGYEVLEAENGKDALEILEIEKYHIDAILLDIIMPVMSGKEFLEKRRKNQELLAIPVIVLTQAETREEERIALDLGANDFLKKPYETDIIGRRLNNLIGLAEAVSDKVAVETIINNLPGGIVAFEKSGDLLKVQYFSEGMAKINGFSGRKYIEEFGSDLIMMVHKDDRRMVLDALSDLEKKKHRSMECEYRHLLGDGRFIWVSIQASFAHTRNHNPVFYAIITDVSKMKATEEKLYEQNKKIETMNLKYKMALDESELKMWEFDIENNTLSLPEKLANSIGVPEKITEIEKTLGEIPYISEEEKEKLIETLTRIAEGKPIAKDSFQFMDKGNKRCYVRIKYTTIYDENDQKKPIAAIGTARDITDEVEAKSKYNRELNYRKMATKNAIMVVQFNLDTGERVPAESDVIPVGCNERDGNFTECLRKFITNHIYKDDKIALYKLIKDREYLKKVLQKEDDDILIECRVKLETQGFKDYQWCSFNINAAMDITTNQYNVMMILKNIHESKLSELDLKERAQRDSLTGLLDRKAFEELVTNSLQMQKDDSQMSAFMILDIDNFKSINDNYGHGCGDEILRHMGRRLKALFRTDDFIGRLGGDEMVMFLPNIPNIKMAKQKGEEACNVMTEWRHDEIKLEVSCSVGVDIEKGEGKTFDMLYSNADKALYVAKRAGKNKCCIFEK